jgi:hypothetical protein
MRALHNPRYAGVYAYGRRHYRRTATWTRMRAMVYVPRAAQSPTSR